MSRIAGTACINSYFRRENFQQLNMIHCIRTDSENGEFRKLVAQLDEELGQRDGAEHGFYAQFNTLNKIKHAIIALDNDQAVGCGALKHSSDDTMEVKRMFV